MVGDPRRRRRCDVPRAKTWVGMCAEWVGRPVPAYTGGPTDAARHCAVRCAAQRIIVDRLLPGPDFVDLGADADHGLAEGIHFGQALASGSTMSVPATGNHRWCVKP